jgi:copper transport protein
VLLCAAAIVAGERGLAAHAELLRSIPSANAVLAIAPTRVELTFSERVDVPPDAIAVYEPRGTRVESGDAATRPDDGTTMVVRLGTLSRGTHVVRWRAISDDGHPISGSFQFSVGSPSSAVQLSDTDSASAGGWAVVGRAMHLAALSLLIGPPTFLLLVGARDSWTRGRLWRLCWYGALAMIPAALTMFLAQSLAIAGTWSRALGWRSISGLAGTEWGEFWLTRLGVTLILIGLLAWTRSGRHSRTNPRSLIAVTTAAVVLLPLTALNGHSAETPPIWISVAVDWVHLAATAVWFGGLASLLFAVFPGARRMEGPERNRTMAAAIPRFSTVALICVQLLLTTGMYHAWAHVDGPASLASTDYGRTLLVKLTIVGMMLLPAVINLLVLRPRLAKIDRGKVGEPLLRAFRLAVSGEVAFAVILLLVVGRLTSIAPARVEAAAVPALAPALAEDDDARITLAQGTDSTSVLLTVSPMRVGTNRLELEFKDASGEMLHPSRIRLRLSAPEGLGISPWTVEPAPEEHHYQATIRLPVGGIWTIDVNVQTSEDVQDMVSFGFKVPTDGTHKKPSGTATGGAEP